MIQGILTSAERDELVPEVADFISGNPIKLKSIIPRTHFIKIPMDPIPEQYAWSVVNYCECSAWMEDPALILKLLKQWAYLPTFAAAIARIEGSKPKPFHIPPRVWDPILVNLNLPLLNRAITRDAVECFYYPLVPKTTPAGIRVLVATGPSGSGKSFTYLYIQYIKLFMTDINFGTVYVDLRAQAASRFGPGDLISTILDQVNPDWRRQDVEVPELKEEQPSRWLLQLCSILAEQIAFMDRKFIIVLDGLDEDGDTRVLPADTRDMITVLASAATGETIPEVSNDLLRLVLLGFGHPIKNFRNRVRVDEIGPLTAADIAQYFADYGQFYGKTLDPQGIQDMVRAVLDQDDPADRDRTSKLAEKALRIAYGIINS